jgi:hypothetical protein
LFSDEPRELKARHPREREIRRRRSSKERVISIREVYDQVYERLAEYWPERDGRISGEESGFRLPRRLPAYVKATKGDDPVEALATIFSRYLGMSWLLEVKR